MKKKIVKMKRKLNNAGMTLIEILVAMALLVIAIIPLSGGYIYSAQNSVKAKHRQQTSILAHTMIENCKAYNLAKINEMVGDGTFMPNTETTKHYSDPNNDIDDPYSTFVYYFDDTKVFGDGEGASQKYDLKMTITPISAAKKDIMSYNKMNKYSDAIFNAQSVQETGGKFAKECDTEAYKYALDIIVGIVNTHGASQVAASPGSTFTPVTRTDVEESLKKDGGGDNEGELKITRTIKINMTNEGTPVSKQVVKVVYNYKFVYTGNYKYTMRNAWNADEAKYADITNITDVNYTFNIYDNENTYGDTKGKVRLANVFLFYYPSYNDVGIVFDQDVIAINNETKSDINMYLIKQAKDVSDMPEAKLINAENSYNPIVQYTTSEAGKKAYIHHNFNMNLGGSSYSTAWAKTYGNADLIWQNFSNVTPEQPNKPEALVDDNPKQLMYKVEVEIYQDDAFNYDVSTNTMTMSGDALSSMDATFLNW